MATRTKRRKSRRSPAQRKRDLEALKKVKPVRGLPKDQGVKGAEARLEQEKDILERAQYQRRQHEGNLADAEQSLGEEAFSGVPRDVPITRANTKDAVEGAAAGITLMRAEREIFERAEAAQHRKVDEAQRAVWLAQADELDEEADGFDGEADELQEQVDPLLEQVRTIQGVDYVPKPPDQSATTGPLAPSGVGAPVTYVAIPKTQALRNQAVSHRRQAHALRAQVANTPEARASQAAADRKAREEWLEWERQNFDRQQDEEARAKVKRRNERNEQLAHKTRSKSLRTDGPFEDA